MVRACCSYNISFMFIHFVKMIRLRGGHVMCLLPLFILCFNSQNSKGSNAPWTDESPSRSYLDQDSSVLGRSKIYESVHRSGVNAKQTPARRKAVTRLVAGIKDPDSGNAGQAIRYLTEFNISDFDSVAKDTLLNIFKRRSPHYNELMKLLGYLQLTQARDGLRAIAQDSKSPGTERWAALVALARMGDSYATNDIIARVRRFPVNDNVVYQIFPDLVYTRQRPVFEILIQALNSDAKNCQSANAENITKIPCAYRIMEMIAPAIEGYPYKLDESGDIDAENYEEALITVREWFKTNPDYTILTDRY
jgi:hypothetical protein